MMASAFTPGASCLSTSARAASRPTCSAASSGMRSQQLPHEMFDPVPADIRAREDWPGRRDALEQAHFPDANTPIEALNAFQTRWRSDV